MENTPASTSASVPSPSALSSKPSAPRPRFQEGSVDEVWTEIVWTEIVWTIGRHCSKTVVVISLSPPDILISFPSVSHQLPAGCCPPRSASWVPSWARWRVSWWASRAEPGLLRRSTCPPRVHRTSTGGRTSCIGSLATEHQINGFANPCSWLDGEGHVATHLNTFLRYIPHFSSFTLQVCLSHQAGRQTGRGRSLADGRAPGIHVVRVRRQRQADQPGMCGFIGWASAVILPFNSP